MADRELGARIERLMRGDFRIDDLMTILLYARGKSNGSQAVQEMGDFVAHKFEREKGPVSRSTRDWYITAFYYFLIQQGGMSAQKLPTDFPEFLRAAMRRATHQKIKKDTGLSRTQARKIIEPMIAKFARNADGSLSVNQNSREDLLLIKSLTSELPANVPAFDNDALFSDLKTILKREGLLADYDLPRFENLKIPIGLYAISVMHNSVMKIGGSLVPLAASKNAVAVGDLGVMAPAAVPLLGLHARLPPSMAASIPGSPVQVISMTTVMFATGIDADAHCTPDLLSASLPWSGVPLEVKPDQRLGILS